MFSQPLINRRLNLITFFITLTCFFIAKFFIDRHYNDIQIKEFNKHTQILEKVQTRIQIFESSRIRALESLAKNWPASHPNLQQWFTNESLDILYILPAINSIWFKSVDETIRWRVPLTHERLVDISSLVLPDVVNSNDAITSDIEIGSGKRALVYAKPIFIEEVLHGWVIVIVDIGQAFKFLIQEYYHPGGLVHFATADEMGEGVIDENVVTAYPQSIVFGNQKLTMYLNQQHKANSRLWYLYIAAALCCLFGAILRMLFYKSAKAHVSQQRFVAASKSSLDGLLLFAPHKGDYFLTDYNAVAKSMFGIDLSNTSLTYSGLLSLLNLTDEGLVSAAKMAIQGNSFDGNFHLTSKLNNIEHIKLQIVSAGDDIAVTIRDITREIAMANEIAYQANHDSLTGLYNRYAFDRQLKQTINRVLETDIEATLCYIDLDQFKIVNDTAGHLAGDELLNQLGLLIQQVIDDRHVVARLGGDEFGIIFVDCNSDYVYYEAGKLLECINDYRLVWEDHLFRVGASIGLAQIHKGQSAAELMKAADVACYVAKDNGRNRINVYSEEDEELNYHKSRINWANRIQEALEQSQFQLFCQKIKPLNDKFDKELNVEILIRMQNKNGELISPGVFIPAAERFSLMGAIDKWVVLEALKTLADSPVLLNALKKCAINLSGASITDEDFAKLIKSKMLEYAIPPEKICFEITETEAVTKLNRAERFITILREFGCKFALDDFGAGMCSFSYLKHLPVDYVKIDGHFIKNMEQEATDVAIVKSINDIANSLGKRTIAEFVGNESTLRLLEEIGVNYVQGFHVDKPKPFVGLVEEYDGYINRIKKAV